MTNLQLFQQLFYNSPNAFFFTKPDGSIIDANKSATDIFNYSKTELIEKGRDGLFKIDHLQDSLKKRIEDGSVHIEAIGIRKDGKEFPVDIFSWFVNGADGNLYTANLIEDTTEQKEQQNHLEMMYMLSNDMIGIANNGRFLTINPAGTVILGYNEQELLALNFLDLIHPDDLQKSKEERDKVVNGQQSTFFMNRYRCKNGDYKWLEWNTTFKDGKTFFIARDVSTFIKEQEQLRLLESAIGNSKDAIVITEAEPFELPGPKILFVNDALVQNTGYSKEEIIGNTPRIFQGEKTDKKELTILKDALKKKEACEIEIINYKKNGEEFWVNVSVFPLKNDKGILTHWVSIQKNITERKKIEQDLIKSNRIIQFTSKVNELILKATNKDDIINTVPSIGVDVGGFEFVWFTKPDKETNGFKTLAYAGNEAGYTNFTQPLLSTMEVPYGNGPSGRAYRIKKYYYSNDIANDPNMLPWREEALKRGFLSVISIPVIILNEVKYIINFYNSQVNSFNPHEIKLLENLADNIAFALNALYNKNKREETELSLLTLSMAIEQSSSTVVITNTKGTIEYINDACTKLTGYKKEELIGQNSSIFKTGYTTKEEYEHLWNTLRAGNTWQGIFCNKKKNGEIYWESAVISPVINLKGTTINYVAVKEDITQKRALEEEQKLLTDILKNSNAAIVISDMTDRILFLNDAGRKLISLSPSEDVSRYTTKNFLSDKSIGVVKDFAIPSLLQYDSWEGELELISKEGKIIPAIMISMLHRNQKGEPDLKSTTILDITERKKNEAELIKLNKELKSLSNHLVTVREEERKIIAKDIHDELGQSLTLLKLDISWLLAHLDDNKESLTGKLEQIKNTTDETVKTSRRLYNSIYPQMLDDIGLISTIKWHCKSYLENQNIIIKINTNIDTDTVILNHAICLTLFRIYQESFTNILRHANAKKVEIDINEEDNTILMTIFDDGIGFEIDKVDTKLHHGLLGIRERVQALNGTILIESAIGKGTCTRVRIPI